MSSKLAKEELIDIVCSVSSSLLQDRAAKKRKLFASIANYPEQLK
jgi:hypothetical protein